MGGVRPERGQRERCYGSDMEPVSERGGPASEDIGEALRAASFLWVVVMVVGWEWNGSSRHLSGWSRAQCTCKAHVHRQVSGVMCRSPFHVTGIGRPLSDS